MIGNLWQGLFLCEDDDARKENIESIINSFIEFVE